jgi:hypothetical protein
LTIRRIYSDKDKAHTAARLKLVIAQTPKVGKTSAAYCEALLAYAGSIIDLVQRQEHGGAREQESIGFDDSRRVVFQTLVVLYELSMALSA